MHPEPFTINVEQPVLDDLFRRLQSTRWAEDFANDAWAYGTNANYLRELVDHWVHHFDWRSQEKAINAYSHFRVELDNVPIHFIHQKGVGDHTIPLIMSHGWPWTFWDFAKVIGPLTDPAAYGGDPADAFDVVVPSLPGFGYSSPLRQSGIDARVTADLWRKLMVETLGYTRFAAQGGDWGAFVTAQLGHKYADDLLGIHLIGGAPLDCFDKPLPDASDYAADEAGWHAKTQAFFANESGYSAEQSTKPQSLAFGLNDSPVGLAAWLIEKRRSWSDCDGDVERRFTKDELITSIMLYWLTGTIGTSARYYYENRKNGWQPSHDGARMVDVPTGCLKLEADVCHWPRSLMEANFDLQRWTRSTEGGHFAPAEVPELVVAEIRDFFRPMRGQANLRERRR